jgi:hypothetical protein
MNISIDAIKKGHYSQRQSNSTVHLFGRAANMGDYGNYQT